MKSFNEEQGFKPKEQETIYLIIEKKTDGEVKELDTLTNTHPLSSEEKFRELSKACKKLFPGTKFQSRVDSKLGLHLINTGTQSAVYIKQKS